MPTMLKHQQFEDNEIDIMESKISKRQHVDIYNNKKGENLEKYMANNNIYVHLFSYLQKESNRLIDLNKKKKNLNHLLYITKFGQSNNCQLCVRVSRQKKLKSQKKSYIGFLQEEIESKLISTVFTASSTTNSGHLIRGRLKSHLFSNYR